MPRAASVAPSRRSGYYLTIGGSMKRREFLGSDFPASTMVQVVALARPELLLEINAIAVVPESSVRD